MTSSSDERAMRETEPMKVKATANAGKIPWRNARHGSSQNGMKSRGGSQPKTRSRKMMMRPATQKLGMDRPDIEIIRPT